MNPRHLLRMSKWARRPPSERRVKLVFGMLLACGVLAGIQYLGWWPDWATLEPAKFRP
ncbi:MULTISPECIES: hypothetical protein [unclassified Ruegeria]|uniref:hypothetical protein n=1 Tax=unclassified Ruegeria TaxID=2625375 RepID=UPI0014884B03|nr:MULTISPECIES: hypothetical protein [unclassified Ruegeria]